LPVHQERRRLPKEVAEDGVRLDRQSRSDERLRHELNPAIARALVERERRVAHAETRMSSLLDITPGAAKAPDEKIAQARFGIGHVAAFIHGPQDIVARDLRVKGMDQTFE